MTYEKHKLSLVSIANHFVILDVWDNKINILFEDFIRFRAVSKIYYKLPKVLSPVSSLFTYNNFAYTWLILVAVAEVYFGDFNSWYVKIPLYFLWEVGDAQKG